MQGERLPLHHAAKGDAPINVMEMLFKANPEAVTEPDEARR